MDSIARKISALYKEQIKELDILLSDPTVLADKPTARRLYSLKNEFEVKDRNYSEERISEIEVYVKFASK